MELAPDFQVQVMHVGAEREPVLIIDGLLREPDTLVRAAEGGAPFRRQSGDFYPGIRKPLDPAYGQALCQHLQELFLATFNDGRAGTLESLSCLLSLSTTPEAQLRPIQSVPHFDSNDRNQIAGVHYLCGEECGGTSFYRHRSSGFETMDGKRLAEYAPRLKAEVMALNARQFAYIRGDTALFERTGGVAARFNRAIYYRSNLLHSGDIPAHLAASPGAATARGGRLTANTLLRIGPAS